MKQFHNATARQRLTLVIIEYNHAFNFLGESVCHELKNQSVGSLNAMYKMMVGPSLTPIQVELANTYRGAVAKSYGAERL